MKSSHLPQAYGDDLAYIHDVGYGGFAAGIAPELLRLFQRAGIRDGLVVDLGCGSGIWGERLLAAGYEVRGIDISPAMIELAKRRAPQATYHVGSWRQAEWPQCRAITALGEVLCFMFDGANASSLTRLLKRAYDSLEPGGLLVFDVAEIGLDRTRPPACRIADDWACVVHFDYDASRDRLTRHIVTFRRTGELYRRGEETHRLQLYDGRRVARLLREIGFRVRWTRRFGKLPLLPKRIGFVARKP